MMDPVSQSQSLETRIDQAVREAETKKRAVFDRMHKAEADLSEAHRFAAEMEEANNRQAAEIANLVSERDALQSENASMHDEVTRITAERDALKSQATRMLEALSWNVRDAQAS